MLSYYVLACLLLVISFTDVTTGMYCLISLCFVLQVISFFYDEFESAIALHLIHMSSVHLLF